MLHISSCLSKKDFWCMQIKELEPYVYIYCQNPALEDTRLQEMFGSIVASGEIVSLENKGREGEQKICACDYVFINNFTRRT